MSNIDDMYCFVCKRIAKTEIEIKNKPYKRKIWKCVHCNTILGIKGLIKMQKKIY